MSKIKLLNNQGDEVTIEHSDALSKQGNSVVNIKDVTKQVDTIADLKLLDGSHKLVYATGYYTKGDGAFGSHVFEWDATSTEADNGGTIIKLNSVTTGRYKLKYDGAVNVKWFGAKSDGSDSSSILQKVINDFDVLFIDSSYRIGTSITISSNKSIIGINPEVSEIYCNDGFMTADGGNSLLILATNSSNITIENITLNGNVGASDLSVYPNVAGTTNPLGRAANLLALQSNEYVKIQNCKFINSIYTSIKEYGVFSDGSAGSFISIEDCYFDNVLGNCIDGEIKNIRVVGNTVNLTGDIRGTSSGGTRGGLVVVTAQYGVISSNTVRQTTDSTIYITGNNSRHIIISNNSIRYSGKDAIKVLDSATDCLIDGNSVIASGSSCIGTYDDGINDNGDTIISNNSIGYIKTPTDILDPLNNYQPKTINGCNNQSELWNTTYNRVGINLASSHSKAIGNKIYNVLGCGISCTEDHCQISDNSITNSSGVGIRQQSTDFTVTSNIISNVGTDTSKAPDASWKDAIQLLTGANEGAVSDNQISTSQQYGIFAFSDTKEININSNNIIGCASYPIYINSAASSKSINFISINNNVITSSSSVRAIYLRHLDKVVVSNNTINTASDGIRIDTATHAIVSSNMLYNTSDGIRISGTTTSSTLSSNIVDTSSRGVVVDSGCNNASLQGNIGINCSTSTVTSSASNTVPATLSDLNI